jgi:phosphoribosylformylglycinamidine cyclo-ligase
MTKNSWDIPPVFDLIQAKGNVAAEEMFRVFNMGIGMMMVVPEKEVAEILERLRNLGERAYQIGSIEKREPGQQQVVIV